MHRCRFCLAGLSLLLGLLSGCASLDLATDPAALPAAERDIAKKIIELTEQRCVRVTVRMNDAASAKIESKLHTSSIVKRFYSSPNSSWFKAEVVTGGTWDNIYFHERSGYLVCGEKRWGEWADVRTVSFTEVKPQSIN